MSNKSRDRREDNGVATVVALGLISYAVFRAPLSAIIALAAGGYLLLRPRSHGKRLAEHQHSVSMAPRLADSASGAKSRRTPQYSAQVVSECIDTRPQTEIDAVEESSMESFPASDPPSYSGAAATPSQNR
jgi:hypothetical protein